jgi:hypothetical protein
MDLGAILILLALLIAVGLFLAAPLMRGARPRPLDESPEISALLAERDRVINALQELDFDFKLGKVPEDGYPAQRAELLQRGASILKELDQRTPQPATGQDASERRPCWADLERPTLRPASWGTNASSPYWQAGARRVATNPPVSALTAASRCCSMTAFAPTAANRCNNT